MDQQQKFWVGVVLPFARDLAQQVAEGLRRVLGQDAVTGLTACGDIKTRADAEAERVVEVWMQSCPFPAAVLIEGTAEVKLYCEPGIQPAVIFVIDELDGSRVFLRQGRYWSICVGAGPYSESPKLGDLQVGVIRNLNGEGEELAACRGCGVTFNGESLAPPVMRPGDPWNFDVEISGGLFPIWGAYLAPFEGLCRNGVQVVQSSGWSARTIALGLLTFFVHLPSRIKRKWPELVAEMQEQHGGATGAYPWDLCAAYVILTELGCVVMRSDGRSMENVDITNPIAHDVLFAQNREVAEWVVARLNEVEERLVLNYSRTLAFVSMVLGRPPRGQTTQLS